VDQYLAGRSSADMGAFDQELAGMIEPLAEL